MEKNDFQEELHFLTASCQRWIRPTPKVEYEFPLARIDFSIRVRKWILGTEACTSLDIIIGILVHHHAILHPQNKQATITIVKVEKSHWNFVVCVNDCQRSKENEAVVRLLLRMFVAGNNHLR